ncbi:hypothetical protein [Kitasatospora cineracea]
MVVDVGGEQFEVLGGGGDGDPEREVPVLVATMDAAVAAGRNAR